MKLKQQQTLRKFFILLFFLTAVTVWGQSFTINRGIGVVENTITGIDISYNGVNTCVTSPSNQNANIQMVLTAQPGYSFTVTSILGTAVRSSSGKNDFNFQFINGSSTINGTKLVNFASSSSCNGGTTVPNIIVPAASQTVTSGNSVTINIVRGTSNGVSGAGYSHMKTLNINGVVSGPSAPDLGGNLTQTFTYGTAGNYSYTLTGSPAPTVSATLNPSGSLPSGLTLNTTNNQINVAANTPVGVYDIILSATNSGGTDTQNVSLTVNKADQTITFSNIIKNYGDADFNLTATGGSSGESITYVSSDPAVATIVGSTVTIVGAGTANITASQAGNANYNAATDVMRTLTVNKANQTISNFTDITKTFGDADFSLTATGGASGEPVTYTSSDNNVASIIGNTVTIVGAGTTTITASQAGNDNYNATSLAHTLTVAKALQSITFSDITKTYGDSDFTLTATGGASGETVTYVSSNTSVAIISGNTVTIVGNGTTNITASQAGNANYDAATDVVRTLTVDVKPITITGVIANNKTYDGNTEATLSGASVTASEIVGSDDVALGSYTASFNNSSVGTSKPVTINYQLTGTSAGKYILTQPSGIVADITAKQLTISGIQIDNKTYDGNTSATITGTPVLNGVVNTDDVTLDSTSATAAFSDPNTGAAIPVVVTGYSIAGTSIANYTLEQPQGLTANITSIALQDQTITFNPIANVTYGDADFNLSASADSGLNITYTSSDTSVATINGNTVTVLNPGTTVITANQSGDSSYNPAPAVQQQLTVIPKTLIVTNATIADKTYDKTTTAVANGTLSGVINSDNVILVSAATFTTDDAGNNIPVTAQYSITGTDTFKYTLTQPTVTGNIIPATLTLATPTAANKAYDATTSATISGTLTGILGGDIVTLNGTGTFASENVGTGIAVTANATLSGADATNYTLTQPTGLTANITSLALTVNATASDKTYDRMTDATITVSQINGLVSGDDVTVTGNGIFNNFNVGTAKPITANLILTGTDAANYTLTQPTGLTAAIITKSLTVDTIATTVADKTYNNTTTATLVTPTLTGVVSGDETLVTLTGGNFIQTTPGTGIAVNNVTLSGTAATNYQLIQPTTLTGNILPKVLTITNAAAQDKVYDGNTTAVITGTLSGIVGTESVTLNGTGAFVSENVANGIIVTSSSTLSGTDATNYTLTQPIGLIANITAKQLNVTATALDKIYDQTTNATVNNAQLVASGIIAGDDVTLAATTVLGTFANSTAGNNKNVTASFTLQGTDAANYTVAPQTFQASITPLTLTVDISAATVAQKTYDATTNGAVINGATLNGVIAGDNVNTTGVYASANVGTGIAVTLSLAGSSAANYTLTQPTPGLSGEIIKKALTATADNKAKAQGAANPALSVSYSGFAGGQTAATASGFVSPTLTTNAVAGSPVGAYAISIIGGSADNYSFILNDGWLVINPAAATPSMLLGWNFTGESSPATSNADISNTNLDSSKTLTRGSNANSSTASNSFRTIGFKNEGIAVTNTDYFEFSVSSGNTYQLNLSSISATLDGTVTFGASPGVSNQFAYSTDGTNFTLIGSPSITIMNSAGDPVSINVDLSGVTALQNVQPNTSVKFRFYASGQTTTGGWGFNSPSSTEYGLAVYGSLSAAPVAPQITSTLAANSFVGDTEIYQITASGTPVIALSATNLPTGATIDNNGLITFDGTTPAGVYNINLNATGYYGTDSKVLAYTINKLDQFLTFSPDPLPNKFDNDAPFSINVTNSAPLGVNYSSSDTSVATITQDGTITITGVGTVNITASNTGDAIYNAVSITRALTVLPAPQITATPASISFTAVQGQGPSATTQLTSLSAINLVPASGDITLTTSTGFELAMGIGSYGTTGSFAYTGAAVNQTNPQIFVRFAAGQTQGTYNGTLTISGGNGTIQVPLTAIVDPAPAINTTNVAYGPYCSGTENIVDIAYTVQGTFSSGSFYVQHSDATGTFPNDFSNIISTSSSTSPIQATLPSTLVAGNYRIRIVHLSSGLVLTTSINDNGSDIVINTTTAPTTTALTFCNAATVAELTATGTDLKWYAAANGGAELASTEAVATGNYFVSQTLNNCESTRTQVVVTVNVTPAPTATALTFCNAATVAELTATGTNLKWYAAANGGAELALTTALTTGNYFVSQTLNNCESTRTQVAVTVNVTPVPTATALTFCNAATVAQLTATGTNLKWYAAANGGTELASTEAVATGNYFVSQKLNNCESTRTQVAVTVNVTPAPTATALTFCNAATVAQLTATGTDLKWYAAANGGAELASTTALTTGNYFVSQTLNNCESTRTQVAVTVNVTPAPTATALTFCNAATVAQLTATGTNLKWYAAANGGTELASTEAVATGNYFVSQTLNNCESARTHVAVTVNVTPAPTATALTFCNTATVAQLTATGTNLKWYAAANGGIELASTEAVATGNYFVSQTLNNCESTRAQVAVTVNVTPAPTATALNFVNEATVADLTATGTDLKWYATSTGGSQLADTTPLASGSYFVSQTMNGCESSRTEVIVTITIEIPTPPAPVATDLEFCNDATVADLTAEGTDLKWYDIATGGIELSLNNELSTGSYFVTQTVNGVESERTEIDVTINVTALPEVMPLTFCQIANAADLTATGTNLKWYTTDSGNTEITENIQLANGNYYVSQTINGCESARAIVPVTINVTALPSAEDQTFCEGTTIAELSATITGENLSIYESLTADTPLSENTVITSASYFVSQTINGCESQLKEVVITIHSTDAPMGNTEQIFTEEEHTIADLVAEGQNIKWYATEADALSGENALPETTVLTSETTYFATQTIDGCESNSVLAVTVTLTLGRDDVTKFSFSYFPNPVTDRLQITSDEYLTAVKVFSLTGQLVIDKQMDTQNAIIDMSNLESGVYILKLNFGDVEKTVRIVRKK